MPAPRPQDLVPRLPFRGIGRRRRQMMIEHPETIIPSGLAAIDLEFVRWGDVPPPHGKDFLRGAQITVAGNAALTEVIAFRVAPGFLGILRFVSNSVGSASDAPNITWTWTIDGSPLQGWSGLVGVISPSIQAMTPVSKPLLAGQRVAVVVSNASASSITNVAAGLRGWIWMPDSKLIAGLASRG